MANRDRSVGLVVLADEPALFFSTVPVAEGYLEAVDVENGVYPRAYGPAGEIYTLRTEDDKVVIEPDRNNASQPKELEKLLRRILSDRGIHTPRESSLESLLQYCERYVDDW